jgi:threonyl-tRNA synthetase
MPTITLPDGSQRHYESPTSIMEIASDIGAGLAKAALAGKVDGILVDTSYLIDQNCALEIITAKSPEGLDILRHSTSHLLAHAVKQLFPEAQVTIGPVIENGFYYDFSYPPRAFTPADLEQIQARMEELAAQDIPIERIVMERNEAIEWFTQQGEQYKAEIIRDLPETETITLYRQGDFTDLCRGPHAPSTGRLGVFQLNKVSGAYWRGDSKNEMLRRIYGTAWPDKKQLKAYLTRLEEAEKRDHRKIGKALDLFHVQEEAPGMIFWHEKGWTIYVTIMDYIRKLQRRNGYKEIHTPEIVDRVLWEKSGHWEKFQENMYTTSCDERQYAIKPMNCPCHVQIYNSGLKSYRDLPLRYAEFGTCHRYEPSGTLQGTMRVREFVQDDGHIFCTEDQIQSEVSAFIDLAFKVYKDFGFDDMSVAFSTRPEKRVGSDEIWDRAEEALENALREKVEKYTLQPGEGAFYGPKIEFSMKDCLGRVWQLGTIQLDFSMTQPERLDAIYVAENGERKPPVMLHRAILGSLERFIGILIEHYAGNLPLWLAPAQAVILNITDRQSEYVKKLEEKLKNIDIRVISDLRNEKISFKIREHTLQRIPYLIIVGDREAETETLTVRTQSGKDLGSMSLDRFIAGFQKEITSCGQKLFWED